jgi:1,5-anhydro-D-fructose reductase (1,5-anhydro-D-mannitol-forming)
MDRVCWGILGCGDVTEKKSGPAFGKVAGSEIVAVMRRDGAKAADYAKRHGIGVWYDDAKKLIEDPRVNAVYVATPPGSHGDYALQVAAAGKACYVEKPMARNLEECRRMIAAFEKAGAPLFVAYYRRALPRFIKTRELVAEGAVGEVIAIEYTFADPQQSVRLSPAPWRMQAEVSGGGLFVDLGSHLLDVLDFVFGPLTLTWADAKNLGAYDVEDYVVLNFITGAGVRGVAEWDFTSDERQDALLIEGTRGKIELSCFGNGPVVLETAEGTQAFELPNPENIQLPMIERVVGELLGKPGVTSSSTGVTAARTQAVMDQTLLGYYGSRGDGFWRDPAKWPGRKK